MFRDVDNKVISEIHGKTGQERSLTHSSFPRGSTQGFLDRDFRPRANFKCTNNGMTQNSNLQ